MSAGTVRTTLDAWNGYHSVLLKDSDGHLVTILTPWGRYQYFNLSQGHITTGTAYTSRYKEITARVKRMEHFVDDMIL